jgi:uncharacterized OB-fold protein
MNNDSDSNYVAPRNGWPELLMLDDPARPQLLGSTCSACSYTAFPPLRICPRCLRDDTMQRRCLSTRGRLENYTVVFQAPKGFSAPHIQAFVRLPEDVLVFTHVAGVSPADGALEVGEEMELTAGTVRVDSAGAPLTGYLFRPVLDRSSGAAHA